MGRDVRSPASCTSRRGRRHESRRLRLSGPRRAFRQRDDPPQQVRLAGPRVFWSFCQAVRGDRFVYWSLHQTALAGQCVFHFFDQAVPVDHIYWVLCPKVFADQCAPWLLDECEAGDRGDGFV